MNKVVNIETAMPHITASITCKSCEHEWIAVFPEMCNHLECPACHKFVNEYGTLVSVNTCKVCKREFSVCPPATDWDKCLAEDCESYDESRDPIKLGKLIVRDDEIKGEDK